MVFWIAGELTKFKRQIAILVFLVGSICACKEQDKNGFSRVSFYESDVTMNVTDIGAVYVPISIEPPAADSSVVFIDVYASRSPMNRFFRTEPPMQSGLVTLQVVKGDENISFKVSPFDEEIGNDGIRIDFEIIDVGDGLNASGLQGVFTSLVVLSVQSRVMVLPFLESFNSCDEGDGSLPAGWVQQIVKQNSLGTGLWVCSPAFEGVECNAFSNDGREGDACEIWLVSPPISLFNQTDPTLSFRMDRRFDLEGFQEYEVKISRNYRMDNFSEAEWLKLPEATAAIHHNDPSQDNYQKSPPISLSEYVDDTVAVAYIYYSNGTSESATIFRIDDMEIQ
jgi:hypothetical protein